MRGRYQYRLLALMILAAIAAGAFVVGPVVARALRSTRQACLGPSDAGVVSVGQGMGSGVVALTERPGASETTPISVRMVNVPASDAAVGTVWISGPGATPTALHRRGAGCWAGSVRPSVLTGAEVRLASGSSARPYVRFALPLHPVSGARLIALAGRYSRRVAAVREVTYARGSTSARLQVVISRYAGSTVVSHSSYGTQRFLWPGWRTGFEWITPGIDASVVLGTTTFAGQQITQVAGAVVRTPLWMVLDIVPGTGQVLWDSMNGPNHLMTNQFAIVTH